MSKDLLALNSTESVPVDFDLEIVADNLKTDLYLLGKFLPAGSRFGLMERDLNLLLAGYLQASQIDLSELRIGMNPFGDIENVMGLLLGMDLGEDIKTRDEAQAVFLRVFKNIRGVFRYIANYSTNKLSPEEVDSYARLLLEPLSRIAGLLELDMSQLLEQQAQG